MRKLIYLSMALTLTLLLACTPRQEPEDAPPPPSAPKQEPESAKEVIEGYGEGLVHSMDKAKGAQGRVDIREVQRAVQEYASENGVFPPSLESIKGYLSAEVDLAAFDYDPATGSVSIRTR